MRLRIWLFFLFLIFLQIAEGAILVHGRPEVYYFQRDKNGGTKQSGTLAAGRITIERLAPFCIYAGLDTFWGGGEIDGHNASGKKLVSNINDFIVEGRLGYTLASQNAHSLFTLYSGYGYFHETNSFQAPSPIRYLTTDTFCYGLIGFLSSRNFNPMLSIGLNFEIKFMGNGKSKISEDPLYDDITLKMNNEIQTRLEIPLTYRFLGFNSLFQCPCRGFWEAQIVPFYEYRHFGGREGFPFDFIDTKFHLIGIGIAIGVCF